MANAFSLHGGKIWEHVISEGTLNPRHLIPVFVKELDRVAPLSYGGIKAECDLDGSETDEYLAELCQDLQQHLEEIADRCGFVFGTYEGDGACFGYWLPEQID